MLQSGLLLTQKAAIATLLKSKGIDSTAFDLTDTKDEFRLAHRETGYYLRITYHQDVWNYKLECSPGTGTVYTVNKGDYWATILPYIQTWINNLEPELNVSNPWTQTFVDSGEIQMVSGANAQDSQFTKDEKLMIVDSLREVKEYLISNRQLTKLELAFIDVKLDSLVKASESSGRIQWLHTAIGVIVTIGIGIGLTSNEAKELFRVAGRIIANLFGGDIPLLP